MRYAQPPNSPVLRLSAIQGLRALAALMVVAFHASTALFDRVHGLINLDFGRYGVDLFFVISGLVMALAVQSGDRSPLRFLLRRLIRIVPIYYLYTLLAFLLPMLLGRGLDTISQSWRDLALSLLFIPFYNSVADWIQPVLGVGWTLNFEMLFYLLMAGGLLLSRRYYWALPLLALCAGSIGNALSGFLLPLVHIWSSPLALEFLLGAALGHWHLQSQQADARQAMYWHLAGVISALALVAAAVVFYNADALRLRALIIGVPMALLVACCTHPVVINAKLPALLLAVGDASYTLYLSHGFVLGLARRGVQRYFDIHSVAVNLLFIAGCCVGCSAIALLLYRWVELPITRWLLRRCAPWLWASVSVRAARVAG